ncbi:hypothetical protein PIB30_078053, partial [Stylosanthes scabra]|nr:hypothetical protein [Stylosanthes scabra]
LHHLSRSIPAVQLEHRSDVCIAIDRENLELELVRRKKIQQPIGHSSNWHCASSPNVAQNDALQLLQRIDGLHLEHKRTYGPKPNPVRIPAHLTIRI